MGEREEKREQRVRINGPSYGDVKSANRQLTLLWFAHTAQEHAAT